MRSLAVRLLLALLLASAPAFAAKATPEEESEKEEGLPLEPTREIELSVDEATWLSLDVSPDGQTLVLELLGDLYTLPITGGAATRITEGLAFDSQPRFSPDGSRIAYLSDADGAENLWVRRTDGTGKPKKLSQDSKAEFASPAWTPDGEYVVVSRSSWGLGGYELWMYHVDGGSGVQVTKAKAGPQVPRGARVNTIGAQISPDGRYLYYARRSGGFAYNARFPLWQIARRDLVSGDEDVITSALGSGVRPLLSPDGGSMVYGTRFDAATGLRLRDLRTGEDRWLKVPVTRDDQESRFTRDLLPGYAFLPDGRELVLAYGGHIHRVAVADGSSREIPFTAVATQRIGPRLHFPQPIEEGPVRARLIQAPVQSPDGSRLAFSSLTRLWVQDLPSGKPRQRIAGEGSEYQPAWSPDGRWIAYVSWSAGEGHLWRVRVDGTTPPERVSRVPAFYSDPAWSLDGERIVCLRSSAGDRLRALVEFEQPTGMDLVWFPAAGGEARLVIPARGVGKPHFTDDPERIYLYLSPGLFAAEGPNGLVSMRFDGTDRREHLKVTGPGLYFAEEPVPASDIRVRRDGRWALAHVRNQLYVLAIPPVGGEAPTVNVGSPSVPMKKLTDIGADYFDWSSDGEWMTWAVGSTYYRQRFDTVSFEEKKEGDDAEKEGRGKKAKKEKKAPEEKPLYEAIEIAVEVPREVPHGTLVLRGGTAITMRGDEIIRDADIVVVDDRIAAVGPRGSVEVSEGAEVRDISGKWVLPGFIDTHAHWSEVRRGVLELYNWSFLANLAYGVTAGLDVQTSTNDMFAYQDLIDAGRMPGPRAFSTGPGVFSDNDFSSKEEALGVLRRYKEHYRTANLKSYIVGNRKQREYVVQAAKELGIMPTTEGGLDLKLDLTHVLDGFAGNEHALPIIPLYDDVVQLVAKSRIGYTPTLLVTYGGPFGENYFYTHENVHDDPKLRHFAPHEAIDARALRVPWFHEQEYSFDEVAASAAKIVRAGGLVGVGAHGQLQGLGYHWELWALASGMTNHEALRCATILGAEIIGREQDLGSLEQRKKADLLVLDADPLADIRNSRTIRWVVKNGEMFEADTLNQVWPERVELPAMWWWSEDPAETP